MGCLTCFGGRFTGRRWERRVNPYIKGLCCDFREVKWAGENKVRRLVPAVSANPPRSVNRGRPRRQLPAESSTTSTKAMPRKTSTNRNSETRIVSTPARRVGRRRRYLRRSQSPWWSRHRLWAGFDSPAPPLPGGWSLWGEKRSAGGAFVVDRGWQRTEDWLTETIVVVSRSSGLLRWPSPREPAAELRPLTVIYMDHRGIGSNGHDFRTN